jgi:hypothetical protein
MWNGFFSSLFSFFPPLSTISFFFAEIIFVLSLEPPSATNIRNNDPSDFQSIPTDHKKANVLVILTRKFIILTYNL